MKLITVSFDISRSVDPLENYLYWKTINWKNFILYTV